MQSNNNSRELVEYDDAQEFSLIELILTIKSEFVPVVIITVIGAILSVVFALNKAKVYEASIELSKPTAADIVALNVNGLSQHQVDDVFKLLYDKSKSQEVFRRFIQENDLLKQLFPEVNEQELIAEQGRYFALLFEEFEDSIISGLKETENLLSAGIDYRLALRHTDEQLAVDVINRYMQFVRHSILDEVKQSERVLIDAEKVKINNSIAQLRQVSKQQRLYEIERLTEENNKKLELLKQQRALVVEKAANSRRTEIEIIEENNQIKLNELMQKRNLLTIKAKDDRQTQIVQAKEAYKIANSLNITLPTQLNELKESNTRSTGTNINVNENRELALYLMGTKYLSTLIETLEARENDALHLVSLNELDLQIETVKNDKKLEQLKARKSDAKYLQELNVIDQQISEVTNDKALKILLERQTDDPYIAGLADLLAQLDRLNALSLDFSTVNLYSVIKPALVSGEAIKPNRVLIVLVGTFIGAILAFGYLLFRLYARKFGKAVSGG